MRLNTRVRQWLTLALADSAREYNRRRRLRGRVAGIESLEARTLLTAYSVTNLNDAGAGSLRDAISQANANAGADTITFAATTNGLPINLQSATPMTITETLTITGNGAVNTIVDGEQRGGGIIQITAGDVTLNSLTLRNGQSLFATGGAIRSTSPGSLTISQCTLSGNSVSGGSSGKGGAIYARSGAVTISQSTLSGNSASTTDASSNSVGGAIYATYGAVTISQSTLSGNSASSGDISSGGAIYALSGAVTISRSTLSGNSASSSNFSRSGAIYARFGAVTISQSTLSGNLSTATATDGDSRGGAIYASHSEVTISQSTLSGNSASSNTNSYGGAIFANSSAVKTILNSIVAGNTGDLGSDMFLFGTVTVTNSLIGRSDNTGLTATIGTTPDASGNLIGGTTDATKINPLLGPLASNGGPTQTHALLTGSLAIDRGSNASAVDVTNGNAPLTSDQRGAPFTRILDGDNSGAPPAMVDMGAFEFSGLRLLSPNPNAFTLRPTFTWTSLAGATSYIIQINNESTNVANFHNATSNTATYTPTVDLAIGKFKMWIRPNFNGTLGNWSAPQLFNILTKPTWQTIARTQLTSRPTLNWFALPGAAKYDLEIDNFSTGVRNVIRQDVTGTSFTPAADLPMGLYRCWIRGVDAKGNFAFWSVLQELLVVPGPTPVGPLSATFDRTPTFTWNSVAGAVSYELFVRNLNTNTMVINGTSTTVPNFTPASNLTDGLYRWWTIAVSSASIGPIKSGGSNPIDIYIGGRPTFITPAAGSSTPDRTPTFSWKPVDGAASYRLQVNRTDVPQNNVINQVGLTGTNFTPGSNLPAGTFRAWVRAVSSTGELSPWSIQVDFTVTESDPAGDVPGIEYRLAGLLLSGLVEGSDGTVGDVRVSQPSFISTDVPATDDTQHSDQQLDQWMTEFAKHEFAMADSLGERLGVSPPCHSPPVVRLSILSRPNTQFLRDR